MVQLTFSLIQKVNVSLFLSERGDGTMRYNPTAANAEVITRRRRAWLASLGAPADRFIFAGLAHGAVVRAVTAADGGTIVSATDGLVTAEKNCWLGITVADCLPIFFYDKRQQAIGLVHAGWRGLVAGIISQTLHTLQQSYGTNPADVAVGLGPCICERHYEFGSSAPGYFGEYEKAVTVHRGIAHVDLQAVARSQLITGGVPREQIEGAVVCTYEAADQYFSYRRDRPAEIAAMAAVMRLS